MKSTWPKLQLIVYVESQSPHDIGAWTLRVAIVFGNGYLEIWVVGVLRGLGSFKANPWIPKSLGGHAALSKL